MKPLKFLSILLLLVNTISAQNLITKPEYIRIPEDSLFSLQLEKSLNSVHNGLFNATSIDDYLNTKNVDLVNSTLNVIKDYHNRFKSDSLKIITHQLINVFPLEYNQYKIKVNGFLSKPNVGPILLYSIGLIATKDEDKFRFSLPLKYETQLWKTKKVGLTTYHYRDTLQIERAKLFDTNNQAIAQKFQLQPEPLHFYMVDNYQEALKLRGIEYSVNENGLYRDGYGAVSQTIFSVMNNEDFSHDMVHYYSEKVNERKNRNWITEEGLAYLWGNAYYTDSNGEMLTQDKLVKALKLYLNQKPSTDLFEIFTKDTSIFSAIAPEVSSRSVIAGILLKEVESKAGMIGILEMINAGRQDKMYNFLRVAEKYLEITEKNFDAKVKVLLGDF